MALQAQGSDVMQVAFASAFYHGNNVIGVPERLSRTGAPLQKSFEPGRAPQTLQLPFGSQTIDTATGAHAAIAFQYLFTDIARVAPQAPFFDAPRRTKRVAALGNLQIAPTAQAAAVGALREGVPIGPTAGHLPIGTHEMLVTSKNSKKGTGSRWDASKSQARVLGKVAAMVAIRYTPQLHGL
jgi:hypothetical protein